MTEQRYDVIAVSRATGLVEIVGNRCTEPMARRIWRDSRADYPTSVFFTISPTGTYKDGDHYPREVEA